MGLLDFLVRHRGSSTPRPAAVTLSAAGRPVFSLETHLANNDAPLAVANTTHVVDHRYAMGWTPKNDTAFVLPLQEADRSRGGIIAPDDARQRPQKGVVLAVGSGLWDAEQHKLYPVECAVGDLVTYGKYSGVVFEVEGIEVLVIRNIELTARRPAGTYTLTTHHVDVDGLGERRVYHEQHTYCEFCPKEPVSAVIAEERARIEQANRELLGLKSPAPATPPEGVPPFTPFERDGQWMFYAISWDNEYAYFGPFKTQTAADVDAAEAKTMWPTVEEVAERRAELDAAAVRTPIADDPPSDDTASRDFIAEERAKRAAQANADETLKAIPNDDIPW